MSTDPPDDGRDDLADRGVAGLLLTGCGSAAPGVAAQVGDDVLTVRDVDTATVALLHLGRATSSSHTVR